MILLFGDSNTPSESIDAVSEDNGDLFGEHVSQIGSGIEVGYQIFGSGIHNDFFEMAVPVDV